MSIYKRASTPAERCNQYNLLHFICQFQKWIDNKRIATDKTAAEIYCNCVEEDSGETDTNRSNHRRGYHDYARTVKLVEKFAGTDQKELLKEFFVGYLKDGNMWFYNISKNENVWEFNYGYDSGD